ncbi:MAG: transglycosylase domain-containing protein, partial [Bacteroidia bacterium]|nr:transglycosylase domain-containing protein [Bacteroidia bacterium]
MLKAWQFIKAIILRNKIKFFVSSILLFVYWLWLPSTLFNKPYSTILVDSNNQLLAAKIANDGQWRFPEMEQVPEKFEKCIIYFEDEYFYKHPGFNPISIFNSIKRNISSGKIKSGGSTLTMQVARMMRGNKNRNYYQKIIEILLAVRIELS